MARTLQCSGGRRSPGRDSGDLHVTSVLDQRLGVFWGLSRPGMGYVLSMGPRRCVRLRNRRSLGISSVGGDPGVIRCS